jgi:hypothetical protein
MMVNIDVHHLFFLSDGRNSLTADLDNITQADINANFGGLLDNALQGMCALRSSYLTYLNMSLLGSQTLNYCFGNYHPINPALYGLGQFLEVLSVFFENICDSAADSNTANPCLQGSSILKHGQPQSLNIPGFKMTTFGDGAPNFPLSDLGGPLKENTSDSFMSCDANVFDNVSRCIL